VTTPSKNSKAPATTALPLAFSSVQRETSKALSSQKFSQLTPLTAPQWRVTPRVRSPYGTLALETLTGSRGCERRQSEALQ